MSTFHPWFSGGAAAVSGGVSADTGNILALGADLLPFLDAAAVGAAAGAVTSVNGEIGAVVLNAPAIGAATASQGAKADTAVQPGALAPVATSGAYGDLTGAPAIPSAPGDIGAAALAHAHIPAEITGFEFAARVGTVATVSGTAHTVAAGELTNHTTTTSDDAGGVAVTVPPGLGATDPARSEYVTYFQLGAAAITFAPGAGVTLVSPPGKTLTTAGAGSVVSLVRLDADLWHLVGTLKDS